MNKASPHNVHVPSHHSLRSNDVMTPHRLTLHAAFPTSLTSPAIADLVRASVAETAERHGVEAPQVKVFDDSIELTAPLPPAVLLAIANEVRRATGRWHLAKHGAPLWRGE